MDSHSLRRASFRLLRGCNRDRRRANSTKNRRVRGTNSWDGNGLSLHWISPRSRRKDPQMHVSVHHGSRASANRPVCYRRQLRRIEPSEVCIGLGFAPIRRVRGHGQPSALLVAGTLSISGAPRRHRRWVQQRSVLAPCLFQLLGELQDLCGHRAPEQVVADGVTQLLQFFSLSGR